MTTIPAHLTGTAAHLRMVENLMMGYDHTVSPDGWIDFWAVPGGTVDTVRVCLPYDRGETLTVIGSHGHETVWEATYTALTPEFVIEAGILPFLGQ